MQSGRKLKVGALAVAALVLAAGAAFAASAFVGVWKVKDSDGKDFQITLSEDGSAVADRASKPMKGKWAEDGGAAVITWDTGWVTKIAKDGGGYKKTAFKKGTEPSPTNASDAEKVK